VGADRATLPVSAWLRLGPLPLPLPALHDEKPGGFGVEDLLKQDMLPRASVRPAAGGRVPWFGTAGAWETSRAGDAGLVDLAAPVDDHPAAAWLASYLETDRFQALDLEVLGAHPRRAWLDGEPLALGGIAEAGVESEVKAKANLTTGKHLLVVETVFDPGRQAPWSAGVLLSASRDARTFEGLSVSVDPTRDLDVLDVLDLPAVTSIAVAPDGTLVAASWSRVLPGTDDAESWVEIRATEDGRIRQTWRGGAGVGQVAWAPAGRRISFVTQDPARADGPHPTSTLWIADLDDGTVVPLLRRVENLGSYAWAPDGAQIVFATITKAEPDKRGMKLNQSLLDRQAGWRDRTHLNLATVPAGTRRRITAGALSTTAASFSPDGRRLLFFRDAEDLAARPYVRRELWELDLVELAARKLRDGRFMTAAQYDPEGKRILILGGPSEFGGAGNTLPPDVVPNDYEGELYVWDPASGQVEAITRAFEPAVLAAHWSRVDGAIYARVAEKDYQTLWRRPASARAFEKLAVGPDVVDAIVFAESAPLAVLTGTAPWRPETIEAVDLSVGTSRVLARTPAEALGAVRTGDVRPFVFRASGGRAIDGRVYLPPDFDPQCAAKYPAIVNYYAGTTPVTRDFGGRYPKEWWAALGYVVYVVQPTGTYGYGQAAAAVHVNDWGEESSREIIEGTQAFLAAHPFVDPARLGCIGASYGGFMTMTLTTKTDLFAAAVSHAGISQLTSYWGEGSWGYSYNAVAAAESFPWNRKDLYVERSPLFHADQAKTPILLTHGAADTNVPVGESDAFFAAMKLLGVPVEFLEIEGQDHWIVDHAKRALWSRSIMAWFDRWLKGQPEWWAALYPPPK
jgi:dipeptidyl aminopeptidase/acylaminoacyl peptidase